MAKRPRKDSAGSNKRPALMKPLRLVSWNVDGVSKLLSPGATGLTKFLSVPAGESPLSKVLSPLEASIVCLQEVQLPRSARARLDGALAGYDAYSNLYAHRSGRARFGVATLVKEGIVPLSVRGVDWDDEGRVLVLEFPTYLLYNVYAPNSSSYPYGNTGMSRHERKLEFNTLLAQEIRKATKPALLVGDFNVTPNHNDAVPPDSLRTEKQHADAREKWKRLWDTMRVRDVFRAENPEAKETGSWFKYKDRTGTKARVDYVLASSDWDAVSEVKYLEQVGKEYSDHCPLTCQVMH